MFKFALGFTGLLSTLSLLSGCQVPFMKPPAAIKPLPPQVATVVPAPETKAQLALRLILLNAEYTLAHDQLLTPANDNALMYYRKALALDPENTRAKGGLLGIVMRYVDLARQAAARGNYAQANAMLNNARIVDPSNLLIKEVADGLREQIKEAPPVQAYKGGANEYLLDASLVGTDSPHIKARLREITQKLKATDSLAIIIARTDNEGRWIYQQLRAAQPGYLVRGDIRLGAPVRVQLVPRQ
jgi:tetratricopeptide (TPR) repeat protein